MSRGQKTFEDRKRLKDRRTREVPNRPKAERQVRRSGSKFERTLQGTRSARAKRASRLDEIVISVLWVTCVVEGAMAKVLPHVRDIAVSKLL